MNTNFRKGSSFILTRLFQKEHANQQLFDWHSKERTIFSAKKSLPELRHNRANVHYCDNRRARLGKTTNQHHNTLVYSNLEVILICSCR